MPTPDLSTEWITVDNLIMLEQWAREGLTVEQIATRKVGVSQKTLYAWMAKHEEIKSAIDKGRGIVDFKVENALLKVAMGYKVTEERVTTTMKMGVVTETKREITSKEQSPNVAACKAWLGCRQPKRWANINGKSSVLSDLDEDEQLEITVKRANNGYDDDDDPNWQQDVNESVMFKGMSAADKKKAAEQAEKQKQQQQKEQEKISSLLDDEVDDSTVQDVHRRAKSKRNAIDKRNVKKAVHDRDYWPDDWSDDEVYDEDS